MTSSSLSTQMLIFTLSFWTPDCPNHMIWKSVPVLYSSGNRTNPVALDGLWGGLVGALPGCSFFPGTISFLTPFLPFHSVPVKLCWLYLCCQEFKDLVIYYKGWYLPDNQGRKLREPWGEALETKNEDLDLPNIAIILSFFINCTSQITKY